MAKKVKIIEVVSTYEFLAEVARLVRTEGYISRSQTEATATATADKAFYAVQKEIIAGKFAAEDEDRRFAEEAKLFGLREFAGGNNDYEMRMLYVLTQPSVDLRSAGFAASAIIVYKRKLADQVSGKESQWLGTVGEKSIFPYLALKAIREVTTAFGLSQLHVYEDERGNVVKWFGPYVHADTVGQLFCGKATVKKHSEFKGKKDTIVNRPHFTELKVDEGWSEFMQYVETSDA